VRAAADRRPRKKRAAISEGVEAITMINNASRAAPRNAFSITASR
jgi:hypothetical protein